MTNWEAYALGYVYGLLDKALKPGYDPHNRKISEAHRFPWLAFTKANAVAIEQGKITEPMHELITKALAPINSASANPSEPMELEKDPTWTLGYYHAVGGRPLPPICAVDVAAAREFADITPANLAEQMGVDEVAIAAWESGKIALSEEQKERLSEILR